MKKIIFSLFAFIYFGTAQDSVFVMAEDDSLSGTAVVNLSSAIQNLNLDDYKKFYIGFSTSEKALEVITLDIRNVTSADSNITFQYTLNTHNSRENGTGNIWPEQSIIRFQSMEEGRISLPEDGKIVFESITQDSLKYWKLKEK